MLKIILQKEVSINENTTCYDMDCNVCPFCKTKICEVTNMNVKLFDIIKGIKECYKTVKNLEIEEVDEDDENE